MRWRRLSAVAAAAVVAGLAAARWSAPPGPSGGPAAVNLTPNRSPLSRPWGPTLVTLRRVRRLAALRALWPALAPPSARRPLTLLVVGDSLGEDLGWGLADLLDGLAHVRVVQAAVGSTGLADVAYYDWPAHLARAVSRDRPAVVAVLLGGNDAVSFDQGGAYVPFGSGAWRRAYGARVARMMAAARAGGAMVVWLGLPAMAPDSGLSDAAMRRLNAVYRAEAARHRGVLFVPTWRWLAGPTGGFAQTLDAGGRAYPVRDPDGVHIAPPAGDQLVATLALSALDRASGLDLCPAEPDPWRSLEPRRCDRRRAATGS